MNAVLMVAAGGAAGSVLRHLVGLATLRLFGSGFPVGTLTVNVLGGFLMGAFVELLALRWSGSQNLRLLVATGFLGGFTTFSAFSLDFAVMWERGAVGLAILYAGLSVVLALAGLFAGLWLVRALV